jgi:Concanavalin A-like lectin/glucanases superfamily
MAVRFDALTDFLTRTTALPGAALPCTMMAWANMAVVPASGGSCMLYWGANTTGDNQYYLGMLVGPPLRLLMYVTPAGFLGTTTLVVDTWVHLAMSVAGTGATDAKGYVNGVLEVSGTGTSTQTPQRFTIGRSESGPGENWNGRVAAVKFYNVVLTAQEIQTEMAQYLPVRTSNLFAWLPLLAHTDTQDYTGLATWTLGGTLATENGPPIAWQVRRPGPGEPFVTAAAARRPRLPLVRGQAVPAGIL